MHSVFPPAYTSDEEGIIGFTRNLNTTLLLDAYYHGIFPWPFEEESVLWSSPKQRGILPINAVHYPKSLLRELKKGLFEIRCDTCFDDVIEACAKVERPDAEGTWITSKMLRTYKKFHRMGYAHSFEAFNREGKLAGGLYGVLIGKVFCGESMFYYESGASKAAFCTCLKTLAAYGAELIDTQMVTSLTASFGAFEIPQMQYLQMLEKLRDDKPTPELAGFL